MSAPPQAVPLPAGAPRIVRWAQAQPSRWRNGRGTTRTLLDTRLEGERGWRVSVADITADAPFSAYPGVQRWFAVLDGDGVRLRLGGDWRPVRRGDAALHFDGAAAPDCTLLGGATRDLNLMLQGCAGRMQRFDGTLWEPGDCAACGAFTVQAVELVYDAHAALTLPAMSLLWFDAPPRRVRWQSPAGAVIYTLRIEAAS